ncbi:MAG: alpha/beta hydrolase [Chloroflexota bacterium]|nr:alpha/beta hydrolase [Chloroflexota bacterium]
MSLQSEVPLMKRVANGRGEPLVLVPGGLTGWLSWIPHAEALAASRRVIRLQLHNVELGLSGAPLPPAYSVDFEVTALGKTLDDLAIEQADFAGWSYGAMIALSYAIHNPNRVRSLTLIEPPAFWVLRRRGPLSKQLLDEQQYMQTLATDDVSEEQMIRFTQRVGLVPEDVDPRTLPQWPVWYKHRQSLRVGDIEFRHDDSIELVRTFEKPVLLVKGEGSTPSLHASIDMLAEEFPNARVVTFPGGHAPHIVSMQPFLKCFTRFLSERNAAP